MGPLLGPFLGLVHVLYCGRNTCDEVIRFQILCQHIVENISRTYASLINSFDDELSSENNLGVFPIIWKVLYVLVKFKFFLRSEYVLQLLYEQNYK